MGAGAEPSSSSAAAPIGFRSPFELVRTRHRKASRSRRILADHPGIALLAEHGPPKTEQDFISLGIPGCPKIIVLGETQCGSVMIVR